MTEHTGFLSDVLGVIILGAMLAVIVSGVFLSIYLLKRRWAQGRDRD